MCLGETSVCGGVCLGETSLFGGTKEQVAPTAAGKADTATIGLALSAGSLKCLIGISNWLFASCSPAASRIAATVGLDPRCGVWRIKALKRPVAVQARLLSKSSHVL